MKKMRTISSIMLAMMIIVLLNGCGSNSSGDDALVADTQYGQFAGQLGENGVISFLGVPYAKQPVGDLRWKEAVPMEPSDQRYEANAFGHTAIQPIDELEQASLTEQGEDCLSLNVWTKDVTTQKPTMVFIHGGANVSGGSADSLYNGENFVESNDVVMVTFNYRLGPFGFLDLSEIGGAEYANSRNLGVLDQLAALKWVKENISSFGGDPDNTTVFGESAGNTAVGWAIPKGYY